MITEQSVTHKTGSIVANPLLFVNYRLSWKEKFLHWKGVKAIITRHSRSGALLCKARRDQGLRRAGTKT
jgi:hypothetical protein